MLSKFYLTDSLSRELIWCISKMFYSPWRKRNGEIAMNNKNVRHSKLISAVSNTPTETTPCARVVFWDEDWNIGWETTLGTRLGQADQSYLLNGGFRTYGQRRAVLVQGLSRLAFLKNTYQVIRRARHMAENMHEHLWLISPYYQSSCQMVLRNSPSTSFTSQIIRGTLLNLTFSTIISCLDNVVDHILKFSLTHCLLVLRNLRKQKM